MKIISLFKSSFDCFLAFLISNVNPLNRRCYLVGSNYGDRSDPNADQIIKQLSLQGELVYRVANVGDGSNTLKRGSLRAAYYFFCSKACFYTHSLSDVIPHAHKLYFLKSLLKFPKLVFLQHGVIGFKRSMANGILLRDYITSLEPTFDYMIVSSMSELALIEEFGVPKQKIKVTGLPRFDRYHECQNIENTVLIFFTWQNKRNISNKVELIQSSGIFETFRKNGYTVKNASHDMQRKVFAAPNLSNEELQHAIATCSLLITDDSSMAWDILYRKQEVIFLSPSQDWLCQIPDLLERRCFSANELQNKVDKYFDNRYMSHDFVFTDDYDNKNAERVLALIQSHD